METFLSIVVPAIVLSYLGSGAVIVFVRRVRPLFRFTPVFTLLASTIAGLVSTPGSWSDGRSQWVPMALELVILVGIAPISFLAAFRGSLLIERIVGIAGLLLFTLTTPFVIADLYESAAFLKELREQQAMRP